MDIKFTHANIYHFYRDLLFYFANFIDSQLNNIFRKIEFNISTKTFLYKDFDASLKLPALLINVSQLRQRVDKHSPLLYSTLYCETEVFKTPLLLNETRQDVVISNLKQFEINIDLQINTESALSALEIANYIMQIFPENQTFQWEGFNTLVPISDSLISDWDIINDDIYYLYQYLDLNTNKTTYYDPLEVSPLVANIGQSVNVNQIQSTFQQTVSFKLNLFVPVKLIRKSLPNVIQNIFISYSLSNELPLLSTFESGYIIKNDTFDFYRGFILSNKVICENNEKEKYIKIKLTNIKVFDDFEKNVIVKICLDPLKNKYITSLQNNLLKIEDVDKDNNCIYLTISYCAFGNELEMFLSGNKTYECYILKKKA